MPPTDLEILQGTLDVLILKTLTWGPRHGYAVARWIRDTTKSALTIEDGALYTALHRMEHRGWLTSEWGTNDENRRVKLYSLTAGGRAELRRQMDQWKRYAAAVALVLHAT
ncbi:MAG: PadR family transcriptional regulator [Gemmatimonadaceae bacterium]